MDSDGPFSERTRRKHYSDVLCQASLGDISHSSVLLKQRLRYKYTKVTSRHLTIQTNTVLMDFKSTLIHI